jgi:hypothetical protein
MASRFIPPPNRLNQISNKKAKRTFSDDSGQSIFHELKKNVRDKHTADAFESVGAMNAIVLEVIDTPVDNMLWRNPLMSYLKEDKGVLPDYIEIRFRVPELHAHLPEPENGEDWKAINRHPKAIMTKDKAIPEVGDIVVIDFQDKNNFSGASVSATVNSSSPPAGGGVCRTADSFASGAPTLNLAQPEGDAQEAPEASEEQELSTDPADESFSDGIAYEKEPNTSDIVYKAFYLVSINEFDTMPEFSDVSLTFDTLLRKGVYNICFTLAKGERRVRDTDRLKKIMMELKSRGVKTGLLIRQDFPQFVENLKLLGSTIREVEPDYFINHYTTETLQEANEVDANCLQLTFSRGLKQYGYINHETEHAQAAELEYSYKVFASANHYDYNNEIKKLGTPFSEISSSDFASKRLSSFNLGGINFLKTLNDPCLFGERSELILQEELKYAFALETLIDGYSRLEKEVLLVVKESIGIKESQKQNFLSSKVTVEKKSKAEVRSTVESPTQAPAAETPVDNTPTLGVEGTAEPTETPPVENNASPGLQCAPNPGMGGLPNPVGNGELVLPPTRRFSEIENHQQLGWTTDGDKGVTNVILQFMDRFTSAYYRRIPLNDPINTGSAFKKIRVTSTLRTASKQVYLMWDKMDKLGENGVWSLYGSSRQWVKDVVAEWKKHKAGDASANARAVASVQANIDKGAKNGKRGHNYGSGVDIHTWSHLKAEGQPYDGASETQMNNSRFIRAIVESAIEAGGKPIVEAYQQHVHITIL